MTKQNKKTPANIQKWREAMKELLKDKEIQEIIKKTDHRRDNVKKK